MKNWMLVACLGMVLMTSMAFAAPKPAIVQGPGLWTAKMTYEPLRPIMYQPNAQVQPQRYWYTIMTIENPTRDDVQLYPMFDLVTDTIQVIPAGRHVPAGLYVQLMQNYAARYPLLQPLRSLINELASSDNLLRQGSDNAVDVLVIWPDFDPEASEVSLYFMGLSNETAVVNLPQDSGDDTRVFLRKTLELTFDLRSQSQLRYDPDAMFKSLQWVMR